MDMTKVLNADKQKPELGKIKTVLITVDFVGCPEEEEVISKYPFIFSGIGVDPLTGEVECLGPKGTTEEKQYVMRFILIPGDNIDDVTFKTPHTKNKFVFMAGVGPCGGMLDGSEFDSARMSPDGTRILVRNMKKNSPNELGYQFVAWVKHKGSGHVKGVPCDPRIINR